MDSHVASGVRIFCKFKLPAFVVTAAVIKTFDVDIETRQPRGIIIIVHHPKPAIKYYIMNFFFFFFGTELAFTGTQ